MFTEPVIGAITIFAGSFAPQSYMYCQGQLISIAEYTALYSVIGTTYGGDGVQSFALPDFRGRVAVHQGQGPGINDPYVLGQAEGSETISLVLNNIPAHNHNLESLIGGMPASTSIGDQATPEDDVPATISGINSYNSAGTATMAASTNSLTSSASGTGSSFNNASPVLAMNYIIAVEGIFPSRGN